MAFRKITLEYGFDGGAGKAAPLSIANDAVGIDGVRNPVDPFQSEINARCLARALDRRSVWVGRRLSSQWWGPTPPVLQSTM